MPLHGDRVKERRQQLGLTQDELAARLNIGHKQVWLYENNRGNPTAETLTAMATALDVSIDYLLGLTDEPNGTYTGQGLTSLELRLVAAVREGRFREAIRMVLEADEQSEHIGEGSDQRDPIEG